MARPKKQPAERRCAALRSDLTIAELIYVREQAERAGLSAAESAEERRVQAALVSEINRLGNQLAALGNLTNQIALYCHTDRSIPESWESLPQEIKATRQLVEQTLEKVLFDHGS